MKRRPELRGVHEALAEVYDKTGHPEWAPTERKAEASARDEPGRRIFWKRRNIGSWRIKRWRIWNGYRNPPIFWKSEPKSISDRGAAPKRWPSGDARCGSRRETGG
ncbi:MAG: hypothetical protein M3Y07_01440 [Acidobacteriota bacterium]|nr:hypothetical protein [Acidobacteriota bacterium]